MSFFVILRGDPDEVRRLGLADDARGQVRDLFDGQARQLSSRGRELIEFEAGYAADAEELTVIRGFPLPEYLHSALSSPTAVEILRFEPATLGRIKAVFGDGPSGTVYFQVFDRRRLLTRDTFVLVLSRRALNRLAEPGLTLDSRLAALFRDGDLYFESYSAAHRVIDLTAYFRAATDSDLHEFCSLPTVAVDAEADFARDADTWIRRKVALLLASEVLAGVRPRQVQKAAREFGLELSIQRHGGKDRIVLPTEKKALKLALRFLDEDLYVSALSSTRYLANSKRKLRQGGKGSPEAAGARAQPVSRESKSPAASAR